MRFVNNWKNGHLNWEDGSIGKQLMDGTSIAIAVPLIATLPVTLACFQSMASNLTVSSSRQYGFKVASNVFGQAVANYGQLGRVNLIEASLSGLGGGVPRLAENAFSFSLQDGLVIEQSMENFAGKSGISLIGDYLGGKTTIPNGLLTPVSQGTYQGIIDVMIEAGETKLQNKSFEN